MNNAHLIILKIQPQGARDFLPHPSQWLYVKVTYFLNILPFPIPRAWGALLLNEPADSGPRLNHVSLFPLPLSNFLFSSSTWYREKKL